MVAQHTAFGVIAAAMIVAALRVVTTRNVVHAALYLIIVLGGVGAQFVLLAAEFLAVVQILIYLGAIIVLLLFGVMLTRAEIGGTSDLTNDQWWVGAATGAILLGGLVYAIVDGAGSARLGTTRVDTGSVGDAIFSTYVIPFEAVSVLLLAALIGAIVLARRD